MSKRADKIHTAIEETQSHIKFLYYWYAHKHERHSAISARVIHAIQDVKERHKLPMWALSELEGFNTACEWYTRDQHTTPAVKVNGTWVLFNDETITKLREAHGEAWESGIQARGTIYKDAIGTSNDWIYIG